MVRTRNTIRQRARETLMAKRKEQSAEEIAKVKAIRDAFDEDFQHWEPIYKEGEKNMKFLTDPWDPLDRQSREAAGRPVVTFDELNQYINAAQNDVRLSPIAPRFSPEDEEATDDTARVYGNALRKAEYRSNAQEAYTTAYDNALTRGFAFVRLKLEYEHPRSFYQHVLIEPVPNPTCCYPYCHSKRADGSDWKRFTYVESYSKAEFEREFPEAEFTDFSAEQIAAVGSKWIGDNRVQVAEFWEIEPETKILREYEAPATRMSPQRMMTIVEGDGQRKPRGARLVQERETEINRVYQYFTNGVELLKRPADTEDGALARRLYPGSMIPFAPCYAKIIWVNQGSGPERKLISMVTLAREPYAAYCFAAACELEAVGTITKNPYWAYEGQLTPELKTRIKQSLHEPVAVLEAKAFIPGRENAGILPLPQRNPMAVDLSAYAIVKEGARRAIQAAIGGVPLMTPMQRDNQKLSGRALDRFQDAGQRGHYHFKDHYKDLIRRVGVIFEDVFDKITDTEREIITIEPDNSVKRVLVNAGPNAKPRKNVEALPSTKGRHALTVDEGPAQESQRQEAAEFLDNFIGSPLFAGLEPPKRDKLLGMSIKERIMGPMGTKMAEVIDPTQKGELPPPEELMGMLQEARQRIIPMLEAEIQQLQQEKAAKVTETEGKMAITAAQDRTKVAIAEMQTGQKAEDTQIDSQTALAIAELRAKIDLLEMRQQRDIEGAKLEHTTAMAERGHEEAEREGDKSRASAAAESERNRQAAAREGDANRAASADTNGDE